MKQFFDVGGTAQDVPLSCQLEFKTECTGKPTEMENTSSRVKTRRGVSGPKMDLLCEPDV